MNSGQLVVGRDWHQLEQRNRLRGKAGGRVVTNGLTRFQKEASLKLKRKLKVLVQK